MKVIIKTAYNSLGEQYWFAINEDDKLFGHPVFTSHTQRYVFSKDLYWFNTKFYSLEKLEQELKNYKKSEEESKVVKTITL